MKKQNPRRNNTSLFFQRVNRVVKNIPLGRTMTYKEVAKNAGFPKAFRAVGSLMAKNYNTEIPCHRVIKSDGGLGNYNRGGETAKAALLKKEREQYERRNKKVDTKHK